MSAEIKIVFSGPTGAGKTTAIGAISEIPPVRTEVKATDEVAARKDTTTVALDYGQVTLDDGEQLKLFGTPGQERFGFMREILLRGALGLIVLVDNAAPNPLADLEEYLSEFDEFVSKTSVVVGVVRSDVSMEPGYERYQAFMAERGLADYPVLFVDVRKAEDVVMLIDVLLTSLELV